MIKTVSIIAIHPFSARCVAISGSDAFSFSGPAAFQSSQPQLSAVPWCDEFAWKARGTESPNLHSLDTDELAELRRLGRPQSSRSEELRDDGGSCPGATRSRNWPERITGKPGRNNRAKGTHSWPLDVRLPRATDEQAPRGTHPLRLQAAGRVSRLFRKRAAVPYLYRRSAQGRCALRHRCHPP